MLQPTLPVSRVIIGLSLLTLSPPCLQAKTRQGDQYLKRGEQFLQKGQCDLAVSQFERAVSFDAHEPVYILRYQEAKFSCFVNHLEKGRAFRSQGKVIEASDEFKHALSLEPASQEAAQELIVTDRLASGRGAAGAPKTGPQTNDVTTSAENDWSQKHTLRPLKKVVDQLKLNNATSRNIYTSVADLCGINVVFDPAGIDPPGGTRTFNLELHRVSYEEALEYIQALTHTFWKVLGENVIFVAQDTEPKRQEYQDEAVRIFFLKNSPTAADLTDIVSAVRAATRATTGLNPVPSQNAILLRGSLATLAIAEKVIDDLDQPRGEVVIEVLLVEASRSKIANIGSALSNGGINVPITFAPGGTQQTGSGTSGSTGSPATTVALSQLPRLSTRDFQIALPGALLQALLTDSTTRLLDRPQLCTTDGGKSSFKVGSRVPYVSGSITSAAVTTVPYATTQFQQIDVGVNVDVQVHIDGASEVSLHVKVELSNVASTENIGGIQEPIIGQKLNEADITLEDGEVTLMGALSSDTETKSIAGIPGLVNVPLLGLLGGSLTKDHEQDEILIALKPHIVREPGRFQRPARELSGGSARSSDIRQNSSPTDARGGPERKPEILTPDTTPKLVPDH